jgi:hypothetical protein
MGHIINYLIMIVMIVGAFTSVRFCIRKVREFNSARGNQGDEGNNLRPMPRVRVRVLEPEPDPEPELIEVVSTMEALPPSSRSLARRV